MRPIRWLAALLGLVVLAAAAGLGWAHWTIRSIRPPLPADEAILSLADAADRPVRLRWVNAATQRVPHAAGFAAPIPGRRDPWQRIAYPVFVLEWADGRLLLVDAGMDRASALDFGRVIEWLGAEPIEPEVAIGTALGAARSRAAGLVFTHLHVDHTQGVASLCPAGAGPLPVFLSGAQVEQANHTTRGGLAQIREATCLQPRVIEGSGAVALPGFPGVAVVPVAGHTPGSQMIVAWVGAERPRGILLVGDVVNAIDGVHYDVAKPALYRWMIVPEDDARLGDARRWLARLGHQHDLLIVPSHDQEHIEALGLERATTLDG
jgi:glyoxylase-like metal-dependent hydrolase (beta-lactamase superfamily II)